MRDVFHYSPVKKVSGLCGLTNLGNTCYMNSVLQCLTSVTLMHAFLKSNLMVEHLTSAEQPLTHALKITFEEMESGNMNAYTPEYLLSIVGNEWTVYNPETKKNIAVKVHSQQDAHEFLIFLLDKLHLEVLNTQSRPRKVLGNVDVQEFVSDCWERSPKSKISDIFHLQTVRLSVCTASGCDFQSMKCDDPESILTLNLASELKCSLEECLTLYCKEEIVCDIPCPTCKKESTVKSRLMFGRLPIILVMQVSRFHQLQENGFGKINADLVYNHRIDFTNYCIDGLQTNKTYELLAVTIHHGNGLHSGHYTAMCRRGERWFSLDDSIVSHTTARRVLSGSAYLLWYKLVVEQEGNLPMDSSTIALVERQQFPVHLQPQEEAPQQPTMPTTPSSLAYDLNKELSLALRESEVEAQESTFEIGLYRHDVSQSPIDISAVAHAVTIGNTADIATSRNSSAHEPQRKRPKFDLDVEDPLLTEADVNVVVLNEVNVEKSTVPPLEKWLQSRGLPITGNRIDLINRAKAHMAMGKSAKIDPGFRRGEEHQKKRKKVMENTVVTDPLPLMPTAVKAWQPFPSVQIPEKFHYNNIIDYYSDIPEVTFTYKEGVRQVPTHPPILHEDSTDDEDYCEETDNESLKGLSFSELCKRAIMKCLEKGEVFLNSGRVLTVLDCARVDYYFVKSQVQASMAKRMYVVQIVISKDNGHITDCRCCCKTQALRRCGHIAAVLLLMWKHVTLEGFQAVTVTGRDCYWRVVPPGKDPGLVSDKQYPEKRNVTRRNTIDPRPTASVTIGVMTPECLKKLKRSLLEKTPSSILLHHINSSSEEERLDADECDSDLIIETAENCSRLMWELNRKCLGKDSPFEVPNTRGQASNPKWHEERTLICNSSDNKRLLGLSNGKSKMKYLRQKIWKLDRYVSAAMKEGQQKEAEGREAYAKHLSKMDTNFTIHVTGLWKNPKYPQLGASPDGLITNPRFPEPVLLEIKRLTKSHVNPAKFEDQLTSDERKRFYLYRDQEGTIQLKENHAYYHQIQMSLDILELEWCHLYVFSESGWAVVAVQYNPSFWTERRKRIQKTHRQLILPEAVLKRTFRHLEPIEIIYQEYHENPLDTFFLDIEE